MNKKKETLSCGRTAGPPAMEGIHPRAAQRRSAIFSIKNRRREHVKIAGNRPAEGVAQEKLQIDR